ncbi:MAG: c-type heme family protein [Hyphomicrobiaceae bacterium]|jgi:protein-histidine pros-kinase
MGLRLKFNLLLAACFLVGLAASSIVLSIVSRENAREQLHAQIAVLRAQALAVRSYTSDEIRPLLNDMSEVQFLPQTVPSFSAHTVFANFRQRFPHFYYKEATLNPTNPSDLALPWERELIEKLRANPSLQELVQIRQTDAGSQYTVAYPLTIRSESCLVCHSTPAKAPPSMVALYGDKNGFGWKMNETIGAQIISAPLSVAETQFWDNLKLLIGAMTGIFLLIMALINVLLGWMVITPVRRMAEISERVSMGDVSQPEYIHNGTDEIATLSQSFNRMRRSLDNAMKMLET